MKGVPTKVTIRKGSRKPKVNLANTYGIKGSSGKVNVANTAGSTKSAVTQSARGKAVTSKSAKRLIKGGK